MELRNVYINIRKASIGNKIGGVLFTFYLFFFFYWGREAGFREVPTKILTPIFLIVAISMGSMKIFFNSVVIKYYIFLLLFGILSFFWITDYTTYIRQVQMMVGIIAIGLIVFHFVKRYNIAAIGFFTIFISSLLLLKKGLDISSVTFTSALGELDADNTLKSYEENANTLAMLYLIGMCSIYAFKSIFYNKYISYLNYVGILALIYGISLTGSRSTLIAGVLLIILDFITIESLKLWIKIVVLSFFVLFALNFFESFLFQTAAGTKLLNTGGTGSDFARQSMLNEAWEMYVYNPFFGIGLGNVVALSTLGLYTHNEFLEIMATMGTFGLILYLSFLLYYFKTIRKLRLINSQLYSAFVNNFYVYIFMGLFGVWFTDAFFYILLFIQLAEAERIIANQKNKNLSVTNF
jgi:O-antigen ligase